jgi:hypothetical protein
MNRRPNYADDMRNGEYVAGGRDAAFWLDQPQPLQARMPVLADDDVVVISWICCVI